MTEWHQVEGEAAVDQLGSNRHRGLSTAEVQARQTKYGPNELIETGGRSPWRILWEQLSGAMVIMLFVAAAVSWFLAEYTDAIAIMAIIALNAALGFAQDYRAERAMAALKKLAVPNVRVRRDGQLHETPSRQLVPGDIILIEVGNFIPADCRLLESVNLKIDEAALTGESHPVEKHTPPLDTDELPIADRHNMAYMGTVVTYGHGEAIVTEIGMETQLGHIARSLQSVEAEPTPLQRRLAQLGRTLALFALGIVAVVFVFGVIRGEDPKLMLLTALSLAVAVVPEGLPAIATVALALGARRMFRRQALIRKLPAVETLGSVTVICSDKTGTLTENRMTVTALQIAGQRFDNEALAEIVDEPLALTLLLAGGAICNDAQLDSDSPRETPHAVGDPTEVALVVVAAKQGLTKPELDALLPRVGEVPFDSERKRMTTVHRLNFSDDEAPADVSRDVLRRVRQPLAELNAADGVAFLKGATDAVLDCCQYVWEDSGPRTLDDSWLEQIRTANDELAAGGMRVLAVAFRPVDDIQASPFDESVESEMIFIGLLGMLDPPRAEVEEAVARCRTAGIRPVMITGDHPLTAMHIARSLGIAGDEPAMTGRDLTDMGVAELEPVVGDVSVYARVAPKDKLHIVRALQNQGHIVAMTGDGVNDAPALKQSHIGVAMGKIGTDVSKEAAQMVLLDDNFATIVNAVEEGRIVYDNIRKFVKYTMTSNAGEVAVMLLGPLFGMPLPLLPLQILWINLVTDGLPGLALAVEPAERGTMNRPPHPPREHIFDRRMAVDIVWIGLLMGVVSLAMGYFQWQTDAESTRQWRTLVFTVLTLSQMGNALAIRTSTDSLFRVGLLSNKAMLGSVLLTFGLQMMVVYLPPLQDVFHTAPLSWWELGVCLLLSTVVFWAVELQKLWLRRYHRPHETQ